MFNLKESVLINIISEVGAVNEKQIYDEILETLHKVIIGRLRDLNELEELPKEYSQFSDIHSLQHSSALLIGSIIEMNGLETMNLYFSSFRNGDFIDLLNFIEKEVDEYINKYTINYSAEELLIKILTFASVLSKITFSVYAENSENIHPNEALAEVEFFLRIIDQSNVDDIRALTGEIKGALECAVDSILLREVKFSDETSKKSIDFFKILILFNAKNVICHMKEIIPVLGDERKNFKLDKEIGIVLPKKILEAFSSYSYTTKNQKIRVENEFTPKIFDIFHNSLGFQPKDIFRYVAQDDSKRAFQIDNNYLSIADKELLIWDIVLNQKLSYEGTNNLMNVLTLNQEDFYKQADNNNNKKSKHIGSPNSRLFRSPIIRLETKILVPIYTWLESLMYLSPRILNRDIFSDMVTDDTWNELIKKTYDEYDLPELEMYLRDKHINAQINVDLAKMKDLKKDIESVKKMPHEIDLLYFEKNSLVIMDLKNYGIQHNFMDVRKVFYNINKQKAKMNKLRQFILERKNIFEQILKFEFENVTVGILTVNPTIYPYIQKDESLVNVISIQDFKETFK